MRLIEITYPKKTCHYALVFLGFTFSRFFQTWLIFQGRPIVSDSFCKLKFAAVFWPALQRPGDHWWLGEMGRIKWPDISVDSWLWMWKGKFCQSLGSLEPFQNFNQFKALDLEFETRGFTRKVQTKTVCKKYMFPNRWIKGSTSSQVFGFGAQDPRWWPTRTAKHGCFLASI